MKKLAGLIVGAIALLVVSAAPARAQYWVSGAFTVQDWNSEWDGSKGFALDFGGVIHKTSKTAGALYADFSFNSFTDQETDTGFVGGFREFFMVNKYFNPYVHASTGVMHWNQTNPFDATGNDWTIGGGGGVLVKLNDMWGVKVQYDFWKPWEDGDWNGSISRWTFGGTYTWGGK